MKNAILVPGRPDKEEHYDWSRPSNSEDHWFGWLKRQLILRDIHANAVEPPFPFQPRYDRWKREFERFDLTPSTLLAGHSCGGGFLVRYLSEHRDVNVGRVVLVAPWTNPHDDPAGDTADFFHFHIDPEFPQRTKGVTVFVSTDDFPSIKDTVDALTHRVNGLRVRRYTDKGHFTLQSMGSREFPELLEELLRDN